MIPTSDALVAILNELPPSRVDGLFFRMVSPKYVKSLASTIGARERGGRFNPPAVLAANAGIPDGFGYLYTSTHPITCLFECRHLLRGVAGKSQILPIEPTLLVTFEAESDRVLDLRDRKIQKRLGLEKQDLIAVDLRSKLNFQRKLTELQRLGAAIYSTGRYSGIVTPSKFDDIVASYSFNFLPDQVQFKVQDEYGILDRITVAAE